MTTASKKITINKKLSPYGTDGRLLPAANFSHVTQKTRKKIKNLAPISFRYYDLICKWGRRKWPNFRLSRARDIDLETLNRAMLHTVMHHSSTSTYISNVFEIEETFCGPTYGRTYGRTFETHFIRSTWRNRSKYYLTYLNTKFNLTRQYHTSCPRSH